MKIISYLLQKNFERYQRKIMNDNLRYYMVIFSGSHAIVADHSVERARSIAEKVFKSQAIGVIQI